MNTRTQRILMLTFNTFAIIMATILSAIGIVAISIMLLGPVSIAIAIALLIILLASYLYAGERLKEIEREEEKQEERVKSDYNYIKRYTQNSRLY